MKKFISLLQALLTAIAVVWGQNQQSGLPVSNLSLQPLNTTFQQYLQQNYQNQGTLANWQSSGITRSTGSASMLSYSELAYRHDTWSGSLAEWISIDSGRYMYLANDKATDFTSLMFNSGEWRNSVKISYSYNQNGSEVSYLNQTWNPRGLWLNISKLDYVYDNENRLTSVASSIWDSTGGQWVHIDRFDYGYDSLGNKIAQFYETWNANSGNWAYSYLYTYSYNNSGQLTGYINQIWGDTSWINNQQELYAFGANGKLFSETTQLWSAGNWVNYDMSAWSYDGRNNLVEMQATVWNAGSNAWVNTNKSDFSYDPNNNNTLEIDYTWNAAGARWDSGVYKAFTYNNANYVLGEMQGVYSNNTLIYTSEYQNVYNPNNDKTSVTNYVWNKASGAWASVNTSSYGYDANSNLTYQLNQTWNSSSGDFQNTEQYYFYYETFKGATAVNEISNNISADIYPNPASSSTNLRLSANDDAEILITIYDALGQPINRELHQVISGENTITLGLTGMASGNYFVQLLNPIDGKASVLKLVKM